MPKPSNATLNHLCKDCVRSCRQEASAMLVSCPRYLPRPFKVREHRYAQLDLFTTPQPQTASSLPSKKKR
ncbi:MAG: hypothetical protein C0621_07680 [Desulfuromonas sp.]|nr:MAG: hypothetical protein C0621_07680 [Desulfuromonas sp.]